MSEVIINVHDIRLSRRASSDCQYDAFKQLFGFNTEFKPLVSFLILCLPFLINTGIFQDISR